MDQRLENWAVGDDYEHFMGRWSWQVAIRFLQWLNISSGQTWLDLGCGTGVLTRAVIERHKPHIAIGLDYSLDFVQYATPKNTKGIFLNADGSVLPFERGCLDVIVSGLALNFIPQSEQALAEMNRIVRSGGVVAAYVWDYADKMEFLRYFWDAVVELDESAQSLHEGNRFPTCHPDALLQLWQGAGFNNISVEAIDVPTVFSDFESYWQPFTLGNFPAPKYVSSISESQQKKLRDTLQASIPVEKDGSIQLIARVWAIRGYK